MQSNDHIESTQAVGRVVVLHGPAAAGKSTVATELHSLAAENTALLSIDHFQVDLLKDQDGAVALTTELIRQAARTLGAAGYTVIIEGILNQPEYVDLVDELAGPNSGANNVIIYFRAQLDTVVNRHSSRPKSGIVPSEQIARWHAADKPLGFSNEQMVTADVGLEAVVDEVARYCGLTIVPNNRKRFIQA